MSYSFKIESENNTNNITGENRNSNPKNDTVNTNYAGRQYQVIDDDYNLSRKELQEGISISNTMISKIQASMKKIINRESTEDITLYKCQDNHRVFELDNAPHLIFKMVVSGSGCDSGKENHIKARYETMINAQTVLRTYQLGMLVLPHAKLFSVNVGGKEYEIIAEQKLDVDTNDSMQEQYFEQYADNLNEAIRQLAVFICKTGYSDVERRNNPLLNHSLDNEKNLKLALLDVEENKGSEVGLFGGSPTGLVGIVVNDYQAEIVNEVAKQNGVNTYSYASALAKRLSVIDYDSRLNEFHASKNITEGNEPIEVDVDSLGLKTNQTGRICADVNVNGKIGGQLITVTMKTVIEEVVNEINRLILSKDRHDTVKEQRKIYLDLHHKPLSAFINLGLPPLSADTFFLTEEQEKQGWLRQILEALVEKGYIFNVNCSNLYYYKVQA